MANSCHFYAQFNLAIRFKSSHELLWCPMTQKEREVCYSSQSFREDESSKFKAAQNHDDEDTPPTSCICKPFSATVQTVLWLPLWIWGWLVIAVFVLRALINVQSVFRPLGWQDFKVRHENDYKFSKNWWNVT